MGVEVAEVAASAAVKALAEFSYGAIKETPGSLSSHARQQGKISSVISLKHSVYYRILHIPQL